MRKRLKKTELPAKEAGPVYMCVDNIDLVFHFSSEFGIATAHSNDVFCVGVKISILVY